MRKHSIRKWVHGILDLLPLLIIPIFALAVRSDNNFAPIEVQAQENEVIDFNQWCYNGNFKNTASPFYATRGTLTFLQDGNVKLSPNNDSLGNFGLNYSSFATFGYNDILVIKIQLYCENLVNGSVRVRYPYISTYTGLENQTTQSLSFINTSSLTNNGNLFFQFNLSDSTDIEIYNVSCYNLTQMFGVGNEPSLQEFNALYPNTYYEYTKSRKELIDNGTMTYNDTDVGSQMVYTLYNATDKYFNFNNVGVFNDLYDWFVLNMFNGNPPLIASVVWNVILYEFIMDVLFLTYSVFMFVVDFTESMIDRAFYKAHKGCD